ncbi:hypothetical protein [Streptomyces sp. NPDC006285]|uniref:hypothetical protein n=1 Tax=Streptomyces sp. NPDC006285 TaxID=3364742 RepID=UPI0036B2F4EA
MRTALAPPSGISPPHPGRTGSRIELIRQRSTVTREQIPLRPTADSSRYGTAA